MSTGRVDGEGAGLEVSRGGAGDRGRRGCASFDVTCSGPGDERGAQPTLQGSRGCEAGTAPSIPLQLRRSLQMLWSTGIEERGLGLSFRALLVVLLLPIGQAFGQGSARDDSGAPDTVDCAAAPRPLSRPPYGSDDLLDAVGVGLDVEIVDVLAIEETNGSFTADLVISAVWEDPRLLDRRWASWIEKCPLGRGSIWEPPIQFPNGYDIDGAAIVPLEVVEGALLRYRDRVRATFTQKFDLHDFPFDQQSFEILLIAPQQGDRIRLDLTLALRGDGDFTSTGWEFSDPRVAALAAPGSPRDRDAVKGSGPPDTLSMSARTPALVQVLKFGGRRQAAFYLWRIALPLCLIVCMSWSAFWISAEDLNTQLAVSSASVLSLIAFQISFADVMPQVPYLTRLDKLTLVSTILVFAGMAESVATSWLARHGRSSLADRIDLACRLVSPSALLWTVLALWP